MKSIDYWSAREARQREQNRREERNHAKELRRIYQDMLDGAQREIDAFFRRYGDAEGLTLAEARRRVSQTEIEAYERRAARYVRERDFSPEANAAMRLYNLTMRVNRLELLKASAGLELVSGYDELSRYLDQALTGRTLAEFSRQAGILGNTVQDPAQRAQAIVGASFHNATWSERIWRQQDALRETLSTLLTRGLALGQGSTRLARDLRERFSVSRSDAERLMSTELRRVQTAAAQESYQRNGNDRYVFLALNPEGPCPVCRALHGKSFPVSELMPGENAPPMHPRCHCSTAPDWDEAAFQRWLEEERRRNRAGTVTSGANRGIINTRRMTKIRADGAVSCPMDERRYRTMREKLESRNGCPVVAAHGDDERFLLAIGAEAISDEHGIMHLGDIPSASAFFEEIIHFTQIQKYGSVDSYDAVERAAREIAANRMLLRNGKAYRFADEEYEEIAANLQYWESDFQRRVGKSYDESDIKREI